MKDKDLLELEVYGRRLIISSKWVDDRIAALIATETELGNEDSPHKHIPVAFNAFKKDIENIEKN